MGVASGPGNFSWEIGNYAFNKKVHNRNCFSMKNIFKILQAKWRKTGLVYVANSTRRSEIWDKFHEL